MPSAKFTLLTGLVCLGFHSLAQDSVTLEQIAGTEKLFDLRFTEVKRDSLQSGLQSKLHTYQWMHKNDLPNSAALPLWFDPVLPGMHFGRKQEILHWKIPDSVSLPKNRDELAFYSILELASLLRHKKISSEALTKIFLDRLKKYGSTLHCVIELTEDLAIRQARMADADFARGIDKGPLQGIPYGIKDLFSVKGTHTTWGSPPYKGQMFDETCFVARQLEKAGAVLLAKLSLGELAMDDIWFGGQTRNPWNTLLGSGGSSAGSAAATSAGLVVFAIGTETYGSIVDPSSRCGVTGLRPTFGSVARTGGMTLAWTSDKIGPICRSAQDAAIVFASIHGADGIDVSARDMPFNYSGRISPSTLRIGYAKNYIDSLPANGPEKKALDALRKMGARLIPFDFPDTLHGDEILSLIVFVESGAAFDPLTRSNRDDEMVQQNKDRWPNTFRIARFVPAVEYLNACRIRYQIMQKMRPVYDQFDFIVAPPETGDQLAITNLTGNPSVTLPLGLGADGMPSSLSIIGKLFDEARLLALAKVFQDATGYQALHPKGFL
jgi:Asp-tRNA(Asn)/Glu-tRNA(Gln) amidotransferase A subunit family amidase